nr:uncharacterized protein LOC109155154 [Ipomoea batatas]
MFKMNVDATVDVVNRRTWISVIVRDEEGQFVAAFQKKWECLFTPKMAEALAIREALQWLKIVGLQAVLVESDAQLVINSLAEHACKKAKVSRRNYVASQIGSSDDDFVSPPLVGLGTMQEDPELNAPDGVLGGSAISQEDAMEAEEMGEGGELEQRRWEETEMVRPRCKDERHRWRW